MTIGKIDEYDPDNEFGFKGALKHCTESSGKPKKVCDQLYVNFLAYKTYKDKEEELLKELHDDLYE